MSDFSDPMNPTPEELAMARAYALRGIAMPPPGAPPQQQQQPQGDSQRALGLLSLLSGNKALSQFGESAVGDAQQRAQLQQRQPLVEAETAEKNYGITPQQSLGGQTPTAYELLTKRQQVPKFVPLQPGATMADSRTGLPAPGAAGGGDIVKQTADGIINGIAPPDMKGLGRLRVPVQAELSKRGFNLSQANLDWQATQKHLATLNSGGQERLNQAINFVSDTIPVIRQLYGEWQQQAGQSGFRVLNKATLAAMKQLPGPAGATAQALETQITDFVSELGTVYKGGGTSTDKSLGMAAANLSADWNPETFTKALDLAERNIGIRKNSVAHSTVRGVSAGNRYGAPPAASAHPPAPPAPGAMPPPSAQASPQSARPRRTVNGETREWNGKAWVPIAQ